MDYNGWTNWQTWNFMLWINNDKRLYKIVQRANKQFQLNSTLVLFLKGVASNIIHTELCLDLKREDVKNINFEEIAEAIKDEVA